MDDNTIVGEGPARVEARVIPSPTRKEVPELASAWNFKEARSREIRAGRGEAPVPPRKERRLVTHDDPPTVQADPGATSQDAPAATVDNAMPDTAKEVKA